MYLSLARKYRPKSFDEVVGQEHIVLTLKNAILQNRINSAYLFFGPKGTGKTSIARILAKSLNCKEGPTPLCCCKCSSCIEIDKSSSLDVLEIDGASNGGIDQIRELRESVGYRAIEGRYKVYIIDEVHMVTVPAFNALLKTLEEPPPNVIFVFATTEVQKVPETISSRTQMFEFRKIERTVIEETLSLIVKKENFKLGVEAISFISSISDGSLRDSEAILDQVVLYKDDADCDDIRRLLGLCKKETIISLIEMMREHNMEAMQYVGKMMQEGISCDMIIRGLLNSFRELIVEAVEKNGDIEWLIKAADTFCEAQERIRKLPDDIELLLEMAIIKLIQDGARSQEPGVKSQELGVRSQESGDTNLKLKNKEEFPKEVNSEFQSLTLDPRASSLDIRPLTLEPRALTIKPKALSLEPRAPSPDLWKDVLKIVEKKKPLLKNPLLEVDSVRIDADKIIFGFKTNIYRKIIEKEENKRAIEEMASEIFKRKMNIEVGNQESGVKSQKEEIRSQEEKIWSQEGIVKAVEKNGDIVDIARDIFKAVEVK